MKQANPPSLDLDLLTALGFGPDAVLMNEPRLFVNRRFLASYGLGDIDDRQVAETFIFRRREFQFCCYEPAALRYAGGVCT